MEGRKPAGVLMVMVNNTEPSKDAEFNKWYNDVHIPEVCATGSYYAATRYECTDPKPGDEHTIALLAMNGPIGAPGGAVFVRFATLAFEWREPGY